MRHCEEHSDEAIQEPHMKPWIASLLSLSKGLAMTLKVTR